MKPKVQGLAAVIILAAALLAVTAYALVLRAQVDPRAGIMPIPPRPTIEVPSNQAVLQMDRLRKRLNEIAYPEKKEPVPVSLALFGLDPEYVAATDTPGEEGQVRRPVLTTKSGVQMNYLVTMAFSSPRKRFCIVNGELYKQGDTLPDGGKILLVQTTRVLFRKQEVSEWIPVAAWHLDNSGKKSDNGEVTSN